VSIVESVEFVLISYDSLHCWLWDTSKWLCLVWSDFVIFFSVGQSGTNHFQFLSVFKSLLLCCTLVESL